MAPPARTHQRLVSQFTKLIGQHIDSHSGSCEVYPAPFAVFLNNDEYTYVEPDISVICDTNKLDEKGCHGAPDWVIEFHLSDTLFSHVAPAFPIFEHNLIILI